MRYTDDERVKKVYKYALELHEFIVDSQVQRDDLVENRKLQWLVTTPLSNIGENASHLSQQYMEEHADIPWLEIANLRNRLVHDYDGINWEIIADVIFDDLPQLIESLKPLCGDGNG